MGLTLHQHAVRRDQFVISNPDQITYREFGKRDHLSCILYQSGERHGEVRFIIPVKRKRIVGLLLINPSNQEEKEQTAQGVHVTGFAQENNKIQGVKEEGKNA